MNGTFVIIYGIIVLIGGFMGYVKAGSLPSLIMGSAFGLLLLLSGWFILQQNSIAFWCGTALSALLAFFFLYRWVLTGALMPAGAMALLSLVILGYLLLSRR